MFETQAISQPPNGMKAGRVEPKRPVKPNGIPDPEVVQKAKRRSFSPSEKLRILKQVDACVQPGEIGALLRKEGLYSSNLTKWRRQREAGQLGSKRRGRPGADPSEKELARLRAENARLSKKLEQAEAIIEVQKKLSDLLGLNNDKTLKGARK